MGSTSFPLLLVKRESLGLLAKGKGDPVKCFRFQTDAQTDECLCAKFYFRASVYFDFML